MAKMIMSRHVSPFFRGVHSPPSILVLPHRFIAAERLASTATHSFPSCNGRSVCIAFQPPRGYSLASASPTPHSWFHHTNPLFISHLPIAQLLTTCPDFNLDLPSTIITTTTRKASVCSDPAPPLIGATTPPADDEPAYDTLREFVTSKATFATLEISITTIAFE